MIAAGRIRRKGGGASTVAELDFELSGTLGRFDVLGRNTDNDAWTNWRIAADYVVVGTDVEATDLAKVNAAILAVAATAAAPKVIEIRGTLRLGTTAFDEAANIKFIAPGGIYHQNGNQPATAYLRGANCDVEGGRLLRTGTGTTTGVFFSGRNLSGIVATGYTGKICSGGNGLKFVQFSSDPSSGAVDADLNNSGGAAVLYANNVNTLIMGSTNFAYVGNVSGSITAVNSSHVFAGQVDGAITISGSHSRIFAQRGANGALTITGERSEIDINSGASTTTVTVSGNDSEVRLHNVDNSTVTLALSGTGGKIRVVCGEIAFSSNTRTNCELDIVERKATAATGTLALTAAAGQGWRFRSNRTGDITLSGLVGPTARADFDLSANLILASTVADSRIDARFSTGKSITLSDGVAGNTITATTDTPWTLAYKEGAANKNQWIYLDPVSGVPVQTVSLGQREGRVGKFLTLAEINALGAVTSGTIPLGLLIPAADVIRAYARNLGTAAGGGTILTIEIGDGTDADNYLQVGSVFGANDVTDAIGAATVNYTAGVTATATIASDVNLDQITGLDDGIFIVLEYV